MPVCDALTLAVDGALATLILLVQFIIYPAFADVERGVFATHHQAYMKNISFFVVPLMIVQVGLHVWSVATDPGVLSFTAAALVAAVWLATWSLAVPAHNALQREGNRPDLVAKLVRANAPRTALWLAILALTSARAFSAAPIALAGLVTWPVSQA